MTERAAELVAVILAVGVSLALLVMTCAALWVAVTNPGQGLAASSAQILTTLAGGIVGVLGAYIGYVKGQNGRK